MLRLIEKRRSKQYKKDFDPRCYRTDYECDYPLSAEINSIIEFESGKIFLSEEGLEKEYEFSRNIKLHDNCFSIKEDKVVSKIGVTWLLVQGEDTYLMEIGEFVKDKGFRTRSAMGDITRAMWIKHKSVAELYKNRINEWIKEDKNKFEICAVLVEIDYENKTQDIIDF
ncbi:MAG: hypothetical protein ACRDDY_03675 [Clostridium sp.]|uniref:hypothetical protein n=1 Tax=Clostridium sp. TaxID=1506 RepID=UPI003EE6F25A